MKKINPKISIQSHSIKIPMPGHFLNNLDESYKNL